jgi:hypothetical protein
LPCFQEEKTQKEKAQYSHHKLPTGAVPVPAVEDRRVVNGWEFYYEGWEVDLGGTHRDGATSENPFPECRKGHLDHDLLKKLGLTKQRTMKGGCLFLTNCCYLSTTPSAGQ